MAVKLTAPLAENLVLGDGYIVRFAAVDPTTGANVSGVLVSNVNIDGDTLGTSSPPPGSPGGGGGTFHIPEPLLPILVHEPGSA